MFHGIIPSVRAKDDASTLGCRQAVRHQTLTLTCVGSNPAIPAKYDPLAQSVEQLPFKQWVWSSNLQRVTKKEISPRGYLFFDTRGDSKNLMEQSGGLFLGIGSTMPTPYPALLRRAANLQRVTAHQRAAANTCSSPSFLYRHLDICPHPSRLRRATFPVGEGLNCVLSKVLGHLEGIATPVTSVTGSQ